MPGRRGPSRRIFSPHAVLREIRERAWLGYTDMATFVALIRRDLPQAETGARMVAFFEELAEARSIYLFLQRQRGLVLAASPASLGFNSASHPKSDPPGPSVWLPRARACRSTGKAARTPRDGCWPAVTCPLRSLDHCESPV